MPITIEDAEEVQKKVNKQKSKHFSVKQAKDTNSCDPSLMEILQMDDKVRSGAKTKFLIKEPMEKKNYRKIRDDNFQDSEKIERTFRGSCRDKPECTVKECHGPLFFIDEKGNKSIGLKSSSSEHLNLNRKDIDYKSIGNTSTSNLIKVGENRCKGALEYKITKTETRPNLDKTIDSLKKSGGITETYKNKNDCINKKNDNVKIQARENAGQIINHETNNSSIVGSPFKNNQIFKQRRYEIDNESINHCADKLQKTITDSEPNTAFGLLPKNIETDISIISEGLPPDRNKNTFQFISDKPTSPNNMHFENQLKEIVPLNYKEDSFGFFESSQQAKNIPQSHPDKNITQKITIPIRSYDKQNPSGKQYNSNNSSRRFQQDSNQIDLPQKRPSNFDSDSSRICKKINRGSRETKDYYPRYDQKTKIYNYEDQYKPHKAFDKPPTPPGIYNNPESRHRMHDKPQTPPRIHDMQRTHHIMVYNKPQTPPRICDKLQNPARIYDKPQTTPGLYDTPSTPPRIYNKPPTPPRIYDTPAVPPRVNQITHSTYISIRKAEGNLDIESNKSQDYPNKLINSSNSSTPQEDRGLLNNIQNKKQIDAIKHISSSSLSITSQGHELLDDKLREKDDYVSKPLNSMISSELPQPERLFSDSSNQTYSNKSMASINLSKADEILLTKHTKNDLILREETKTNALNPMNSNEITHRNSINSSLEIENNTKYMNPNEKRKHVYKENVLINEKSRDSQKSEEKKLMLCDETTYQNICCEIKGDTTDQNEGYKIRNSAKTLYKSKDPCSQKIFNKCVLNHLIANYYSKLANFPM